MALSRRYLSERIATLEKALALEGETFEKERRDFAPGGARNPGRRITNLFLYHEWLARRDALLGARLTSKAPLDYVAAERELLRVLSGEPELVTLVRPVVDGERTLETLAVFPKSFHALVEMHRWDAEAAFIGRHLVTLRESTSPDDSVDLVQRCLARLAYVNGLLLWIVTHPDPDVPYALGDNVRPVAPAYLRDLDAFDVLRVLKMHHTVNGERIRYAEQFIPPATATPATGAARATWSTFFATASAEMGLSPDTLTHRWSLAALVAQRALDARSKWDAHEAAKAAAKRSA